MINAKVIAILVLSCGAAMLLLNAAHSTNSLEVQVSAYTSAKGETDATPYLAAWSNELKPGVKSVAVSRDLLELGITNGTQIRIEGLSGTYTVLDKMNKRFKRKIDIYMGNDTAKAESLGSEGTHDLLVTC